MVNLFYIINKVNILKKKKLKIKKKKLYSGNETMSVLKSVIKAEKLKRNQTRVGWFVVRVRAHHTRMRSVVTTVVIPGARIHVNLTCCEWWPGVHGSILI